MKAIIFKIECTIICFIIFGTTLCSSQQAADTIGVNSETNQNSSVFRLDFENNNIGNYTEDNLKKDVGEITWMVVDGRASIEQDSIHGKALKVLYPKDAVGPKQGGIQFVRQIPNSSEYYLDYYIKFKEGFDFVLGGKLPGLTSGGEKFTGGIHPDKGEGWSARYMWRAKGEAIIYFYHLDMKSKWGDDIKTGVFFTPGKWYRITQHIKLNTDDEFNGLMDVWINGTKVINDTRVRYRLAPLGDVDSFYFSTFHGGNSTEWAPKKDSYIYFDDFNVTKTRPKLLD